MPPRNDTDLRPVDVDSPDFAAFLRVTGLVYKSSAWRSDEEVDQARDGLRGHRLTGAYDGGRLVGTFRSFDTGLTVPGATLTAAAISSVGVLPTHRRRGLLTALMRDDLAAQAARGLGVAVLISAEAPIYGRFGFGVAAEAVTRVLDLRTAVPRPEAAGDGTVDLVTEEELRGIAPGVFERARRPGAIDRDDRGWDFRFGVRERVGEPRPARVAALHRDAAGRPDGYLTYRQEDVWDHRVTRARAHLEQLEAATPDAWAALWSFLAGLDATAEVHAEDRPVDEPVGHLLTDYRAAATVTRNDFLWSRVIDTPTVLAGRRYETGGRPGEIVLAVRDPQSWAQGRFRLEVDEQGRATCGPTHRDAEVTLPVETLSAVWLGGTPLPALAAAGRAREDVPGAVGRLDRLLRTAAAPWCNTWF